MHFTVSTTQGILDEDDKVTIAMICQHGVPQVSTRTFPIAKNVVAERTVFLMETKVKVLTFAIHYEYNLLHTC